MKIIINFLIPMLLGIILGLVFQPKGFGQMPTPDYPDGPDLPPLPYQEVLMYEKKGDTGYIVGNSGLCPLVIDMEGEIDEFQALCDNVRWQEDAIIIPTNCEFRLKIKDKDPGVFHVWNCPVILKRRNYVEESI